ncbi:MAG TPA: MscL family protein, partial [Gemmatimonadaceae bacterium]
SMWREFKAFLLKQNLLALALAVVVGTATNSVVQSIVNGFIMPIVGLVTPGEGWRQFRIPLGPSLVDRLRQAGADSATVAAAADSARAVGGTPNTAQNALLVGEFLSALLNFLIVGFVAWQITRWIIKPATKAEEKPATRACPYCRQQIDAAATRCAYCTSQVEAAA